MNSGSHFADGEGEGCGLEKSMGAWCVIFSAVLQANVCGCLADGALALPSREVVFQTGRLTL